MTTIRQLITGSLRLLEQVGAGEIPPEEEAADALYSLRSMMDSWSIDGSKVWTETVEVFQLIAGTPSYTLGAGGVFDTTPPVRIRAATLGLAGALSYDAGFYYDNGLFYDGSSGENQTTDLWIMSAEEYAMQPDKYIQGRPVGMYYDNGYPLVRLRFYQVPNAAYSLALFSEKPLTTYSSLNDTLIAPPGWERALRFNMALELAPEYGKTPSREVTAMAIESKTSIETQITSNDKNTSQADSGLLAISAPRGYNILANL